MNRMRVKNYYGNDELLVCGNKACEGSDYTSTYYSMIDAWSDGWRMSDGENFVWICPECALNIKNNNIV